jgi:hypothetical protein
MYVCVESGSFGLIVETSEWVQDTNLRYCLHDNKLNYWILHPYFLRFELNVEGK